MKILYYSILGVVLAASIAIFSAGLTAGAQAAKYHSREQAKLLLHSALALCAHDYEAQSKPAVLSKTMQLHGGTIKYGLKKIDSSTVYIIVSSEFGKVSMSREFLADVNLKVMQ